MAHETPGRFGKLVIPIVQGVSSPCCFVHHGWQVSVAVHGDDFTAIGSPEAWDNYEVGMQQPFGCKLKESLGVRPDDCNKMRVLNKIVRICDEGLRYEADPRHAEMLVKALGLSTASSVLTPTITESNDSTDYDAERTDEHATLVQWASSPVDAPDVVASISIPKSDPRTVTFDTLNIDVRDVVPYSEIYGVHPKVIVATRYGWRRVPENANPFTGRADHVAACRLAPILDPSKRNLIDHERRLAVNSISTGMVRLGRNPNHLTSWL